MLLYIVSMQVIFLYVKLRTFLFKVSVYLLACFYSFPLQNCHIVFLLITTPELVLEIPKNHKSLKILHIVIYLRYRLEWILWRYDQIKRVKLYTLLNSQQDTSVEDADFNIALSSKEVTCMVPGCLVSLDLK